MSKKNILIGGAWPYANNSLHIGHLAALLPGDIVARYYRLKGANVVYVSGTDCHGTPITERAKKDNVDPSEIAERYHQEFVKNFNDLDFSYDLYTKTMGDFHKKKVEEYYKKIIDNGYIYEKLEEQDFCSSCNKFLSDREIVGTCPHCGKEAKGDQCDNCLTALQPKDLKDKHCKDCGNVTTLKNNKHLYFRLSAFQSILEDFVKDKKDKWRKNAVNETERYLKMGLVDRATTRQLTWGVDVPVEGYDDKKIYVWIEAVLGYLTASEKVLMDKNESFEDFIKDKNLLSYYVHGKDNIVFHTIIFPALLEAIDKEYNKPDYILSCEYVNMNDEKMSKSKGNLVSINDLVNTYHKDTIRYYMIANGPEKKDINYSDEDVVINHNKFLVGVLGNFINRNLSFIMKKFDGIITEGTIDEKIINTTKETYDKVGNLIETGNLKEALEEIMNYVTLGNKYYDENEPWNKVKENIDEFNNITYTCVYMIANIKNLIAPFMPSTSDKIKKMLSLKDASWDVENINGNIKINDIELLFSRLEIKE